MSPIIWDRVVTLLGDAALKSFVIFALAGAINATWRRSSAASRHLIWATAVCAAIALPVIGSMLPQWRMPSVEVARPAVFVETSSPIKTTSPGAAIDFAQHAEDFVCSHPRSNRNDKDHRDRLARRICSGTFSLLHRPLASSRYRSVGATIDRRSMARASRPHSFECQWTTCDVARE